MKRVNICNSGGRTSAYLTEMALEAQASGALGDTEFIVTFANTGREHEKTLMFVNNCNKRWTELYGVSITWLEAEVHTGRLPCSHKVVTFETASRHGEPFEAVVAKYGLPNNTFLHCTRELKENPIMSYMESLGERKGHIKAGALVPATYETWIGIREDEQARLTGNPMGKQTKIYPLAGDIIELNGFGHCIDLTCDKGDVIEFWSEKPFDLDLPEHLGNCIDCHKKSLKKLGMVLSDIGEKGFRFSAYLDLAYRNVKAQVLDGAVVPRKRFRGYLDTSELIATIRAKQVDETDQGDLFCSNSCEPFMMDNTPD